MTMTSASETVSRERDAATLKVAFFSDSLPERNGTGAYYFDLAGQLAEKVQALHVFQPRRAVRYPRLAIPMPGDPTQKLISPNVIRITREFHQLKPDVVVAVTPGPFGLLGLMLARQLRVPCITAFHTDFEQLARMYWDPISRRCVNCVLTFANRTLCSRSRAVLVNNSGLIGQVERLGAGQVEVMGTPLHRSFLETPPVPLPGKVEQICFAGRLAAEKNVSDILRAARNFPDIRFRIAGDGPLRAQLEGEAADLPHVEFLGWQSRAELVRLIDESSLLILPSRIETFGSIALEAMARGRPALVSEHAGIQEWPQLKGALFTLRADENLEAVIRKIVELPRKEWEEKAVQSREAAERLNEETIRQWADVLKRYTC